ncbi:MAG: UDP-N-acetyl-D-glucosamine dehydrogenase [Gammaproteobacteria bacterium RIFCSPHIGHO2_12_FULL_38_11]|nr:MAG: UDP-N-acetyl-D-glucosamine dehydrogenase [Gammaproteobacteria bacterium RIFCSPHIGHO2_12_FULL_38_11]
MNTIKTAVIGTGYLGKYHVEKLATLMQSQLVAICDIDASHATELSEKYAVAATDQYQTLVDKVDAVNIATPTASHFDIAQFFLENGVHVFIEKPITTTIEQADALIQIAKKNNLVLQVGHIERFNPAFQFIQPQLSYPLFIEAQRLTSFKLRGSDISVILDLMIHDIDIILSMTNSPITDIRATGANVLTPFIDIANARIEFKNGCVASLTASRINSIPVRRLRIFQHDAYLYVDMNRNICRIRKKADTEMFPGVPNIDSEEKHLIKGDALKDEINAFLNSIIKKSSPIVSGEDARNALGIAMQITHIITENNAKYS